MNTLQRLTKRHTVSETASLNSDTRALNVTMYQRSSQLIRRPAAALSFTLCHLLSLSNNLCDFNDGEGK
jgi:hypothetical protein